MATQMPSARRPLVWRPVVIVAVVLATAVALIAAFVPKREVRIDESLDARTEVRPSQIPNAGLGLYAKVPIKKGEIIGELGGRYVTSREYIADPRYLAVIPECGLASAHPWSFIDASNHGGHAARINFAPQRLNGVETRFQNATMKTNCRPPYVVFEANRAIATGEEIWTSYGHEYDYHFMAFEPVRTFFCQRANLACDADYRWDP